ncbi:2-hydroxy-acid oxidase [Amylibacter kogurei]|uniref:D-lactate dehydrogenase (cytochrome) n=1 Tax=Paramylibacter kogurei TaxID=1889778 RepID=A0A2G5K3V5_9RHOB|nr:FAD-linked oxidase C-terminal domain-containing protein [Amylibacter kogurei]PIB24226.1 2-hydroxy-acid oxidase [Amylibacter kogurei]
MNIDKAITEMQAVLGDRLSTKKSDLDFHGQNEAYYPFTPPDAVAFVQSTQEVSDIVKICAKYDCPITPWGVGTSLEGHALPIKGGVTIDFSQMNKIVEIYNEDLNVRVQPGITREELNAELRTTGLFFPIDPGANATIGGMTATRASGTTAVRYGTMKDNVLALEVVLADGRIIRTGTRAKKSSAGYDLTRLMVGSEGTLGIITEITLALQGQPEATAAAICDFPDVESAVNTVIMAVQMGVPIARIELVDAMMIRAINNYSKLDMVETPHLFMEFHGSEAGVGEQSETMKSITGEFGGGAFQWSTKVEERNRLWAARHNAYPAARGLKPGFTGLTTDICVPISQLAKAIGDSEKDIADSGLLGPILGHVGDGNYHATLLVDPNDPDMIATAKGVAHRMAERALAVGGTVTGEHGVGIGKMKYMAAEHGDGWSVMADIKRALDPQNILNPGKMVQVN